MFFCCHIFCPLGGHQKCWTLFISQDQKGKEILVLDTMFKVMSLIKLRAFCNSMKNSVFKQITPITQNNMPFVQRFTMFN